MLQAPHTPQSQYCLSSSPPPGVIFQTYARRYPSPPPSRVQVTLFPPRSALRVIHGPGDDNIMDLGMKISWRE